jgi:hypothetical protein
MNSKLLQGFHGGFGRFESFEARFYLEEDPDPFLLPTFLFCFNLSYILSALIILDLISGLPTNVF